MFSFEYTIDIEPSPATELGLKSVLYKMEQEEEDVGTNNMTVNGKSVLYKKEEDLGTNNRTVNGKSVLYKKDEEEDMGTKTTGS